MELLETTRGTEGWLIAARQSAAHGDSVIEWMSFMVLQFEDEVPKRVWVFLDRQPAMEKAGVDG